MCISNVAGNTQMARLDRQVTQNGLGVNNSMARGIYNGWIPRYQDEVINAIARVIYNGVVEVTVFGDDERRCCRCQPIPS